MESLQFEILDNLSYEDLDWERVNLELNTNYSKARIMNYILAIMMKSEIYIIENECNYFIGDNEYNLEIILDKNTYKIISVTRL